MAIGSAEFTARQPGLARGPSPKGSCRRRSTLERPRGRVPSSNKHIKHLMNKSKIPRSPQKTIIDRARRFFPLHSLDAAQRASCRCEMAHLTRLEVVLRRSPSPSQRSPRSPRCGGMAGPATPRGLGALAGGKAARAPGAAELADWHDSKHAPAAAAPPAAAAASVASATAAPLVPGSAQQRRPARGPRPSEHGDAFGAARSPIGGVAGAPPGLALAAGREDYGEAVCVQLRGGRPLFSPARAYDSPAPRRQPAWITCATLPPLPSLLGTPSRRARGEARSGGRF
jgi:hypothetical protein